MTGEGFAFFRWHSLEFRGWEPAECKRHYVCWRDWEQNYR